MRGAQDASANAPAIVGAAVAKGVALEKPGWQIARLRSVQKFQGSGAEITVTFELPPIQKHLAETRIIRRGRIEASVALRGAVAWAELRPRWNRFERAGFLVLCIRGYKLGAQFGRQIKGCVLHSEWTEKPLLEKRIEGHSAYHLDDARRSVYAALCVFPFFARFILHGRGKPKRHKVSKRFCFLCLRTGRFAQPRCVSQDLRDREVCRFSGRCLERGKFRQIFRDRVADVEFAIILQHENRSSCDRLGHGRYPEQSIGLHWLFRRDLGKTGRFEMEDFVPRDDSGDSAGDFIFLDHLLHGSADPGKFWCSREGWQFGRQKGAKDEFGEVEVVHLHEVESMVHWFLTSLKDPGSRANPKSARSNGPWGDSVFSSQSHVRLWRTDEVPPASSRPSSRDTGPHSARRVSLGRRWPQG